MALEALGNLGLVLTSGGAIGYAARQLRHEREYRSVDNLEKQLTFFLSEAFLSARQRLAAARTRDGQLIALEKDDPPVAAFEILDFYDHLGLLVSKGHLDVSDVWHTFYEWAQPVYVDLRVLIEDEASAYCEHYRDLRRLMRAMDNIQIKLMHEKNGNHWALWTAERILDHYAYELELSHEQHRVRRRRPRAQRRRVLDSEGREVHRKGDTVAGGE